MYSVFLLLSSAVSLHLSFTAVLIMGLKLILTAPPKWECTLSLISSYITVSALESCSWLHKALEDQELLWLQLDYFCRRLTSTKGTGTNPVDSLQTRKWRSSRAEVTALELSYSTGGWGNCLRNIILRTFH